MFDLRQLLITISNKICKIISRTNKLERNIYKLAIIRTCNLYIRMPHKLKITITHRILNTMKKNIFNLINNTTNRKKQNTQQINLYKIKQYNPKIIHANSIKQYFLIITQYIK